MDKIVEIENELWPIFENIIEKAQATRMHPSGVDFIHHVHEEWELLNELRDRSIIAIRGVLERQSV